MLFKVRLKHKGHQFPAAGPPQCCLHDKEPKAVMNNLMILNYDNDFGCLLSQWRDGVVDFKAFLNVSLGHDKVDDFLFELTKDPSEAHLGVPLLRS